MNYVYSRIMKWQTAKYEKYHSCVLHRPRHRAKVLNNKIDMKEYISKRNNEDEEEKQQKREIDETANI